MSEAKNLFINGLWKNNSALVQLLGLCPLLAVSSTATNALGLGLATTLVLVLTNSAVSALRRWVPGEIRIPIYVMIIASVVSAVQMLINAYAFGLYQSTGIFIPLIVTNCIVIGRAEAYAAHHPVGMAAPTAWPPAWVPPRRCSFWAPCVKSWATAPCSTAPTCCSATGPARCALNCFIPIRRSCWPFCRRAHFLVLGLCWHSNMLSNKSDASVRRSVVPLAKRYAARRLRTTMSRHDEPGKTY